jgi:hypothetical protein
MNPSEVLTALKLEIAFIEKGGYFPSVRDPHHELRLFRDSVSCPNLGAEVPAEPCAHCFLMDFVPPEFRDRENACNFIPLNEAGETIASFEVEGEAGHEKARAALLGWLKRTVARLERELREPAA